MELILLLKKRCIRLLNQIEMFDALTKRLTAIGNSGPAISKEQIQPIVKQTIMELMQAGGPGADTPEELESVRGMHNGGEPIGLPEGAADDVDSIPDVPGSRQAADGKHYVQNGNGYAEVIKPNAPAV
jgi:hypothetical protein